MNTKIMKGHIPLLSIILFSFASCNVAANKDMDTNEAEIIFNVEEAHEWTVLFKRYSGWFGADGIFALPLSGKDNSQVDSSSTTLLIFSDTLIGEIEGDSLPTGFNMVNNSVALLLGNQPREDKIRFEWATNDESNPISMFKPETPNSEKGDYYWLGDGFVNTELNNNTYIFAYRMRNLDLEDDWSFTKMGTNIIVIPSGSKAPFKDHKQLETPFDYREGGFGAGIFVNTKDAGSPNPDGYIYVYGVKDKEKNLAVARVLPKEFENFEAWRFWTGSEWNSDLNTAATLATNVSNELSVSMLEDGRCVLIYQHESISPIVAMRIAPSPYSTFGEKIDVWHCKESEGNIFAYNAKAHPSLSAPGELLVSYNVNAFNFKHEIKEDPNLYRPRFIKIKFQ